MLYFSTTFW